MDAENPYVAALGNIAGWDEDDIAGKLEENREEARFSPEPNPEPIAEQLLTSNDEPKAAQIVVIENIMRAQNATLSTLRAEILEVHSAVREMQTNRNALIEQEYALLAEIRRCKGVMSPIRRLPPEIVGEILLYFAPSLRSDHRVRSRLYYECPHGMPDDGVERVETPWHLGQICRYWRTVALSLRSLWSVFDLWALRRWQESCDYMCNDHPNMYPAWDPDAIHTTPSLLVRSFESIENQLERSAQAISCRMAYSRDPRIRLHFGAMYARSRRLRHLHLVDFPPLVLDLFSNAQYDQLRSLALVFTKSDGRREVVFQCPPCLTELSLTWIVVLPATRAAIAWARLTKYCENDCLWSDAEDRWAAYRHLENAVVFCVQFPRYHPLDGPRDVVLIPKLQHARLSFHGWETMLEYFNFPALQTLSYDHAYARSTRSGQIFQLPGSLPHLKTLRLRVQGHIGRVSGPEQIFHRPRDFPARPLRYRGESHSLRNPTAFVPEIRGAGCLARQIGFFRRDWWL
ncbi:hypothetical protein DFH06DRAFT_1298134 [Mycena polygramma]|nr:hypothetical protein DFH06DRAFT_1298134 [Mycena polygramma]